MQVPREELVKLLYQQGPIQRFTQDSPILPDVWLAYAENPTAPVELLLTPYQGPSGGSPGELSRVLRERLSDPAARTPGFGDAQRTDRSIAYNQATVAASLRFDELVRVVLPLSSWWDAQVWRKGLADDVADLGDPTRQRFLAELLANPGRSPDAREPEGGTIATGDDEGEEREPVTGPSQDVLWLIRVIGTIVLLHEAEKTAEAAGAAAKARRKKPETQEKAGREAFDAAFEQALRGVRTLREPDPDEQPRADDFEKLVAAVARFVAGAKLEAAPWPLVHLVSRNRKARVSLWKSCIAVKADAARRLFELSCERITWAIIDSGIDARHPAFRVRNKQGVAEKLDAEDWTRRTRVTATYDFTVIRTLLSGDPADEPKLPPAVRARLGEVDEHGDDVRTKLRRALNSGREIDWPLIAPLIRVPHTRDGYRVPTHEHGTHVAGILAGDWRPGDQDPNGHVAERKLEGVCPDIRLYDLRVLDDRGEGDEFNVMAALQFLRHLNLHKEVMAVHGANLSLSIPHDVMNYACGRTPVCDECERLVGAGITVVAAAGNRGYVPASRTAEEAYRSISVTDPGNADGVITVGATHREAPHTYGVSFFSSRGPTGDGRIKPDLVAPGEKIESTVPRSAVKRLDGTSMAAPHVSGAAALLMAQYAELIGRPRRIKDVLCGTATDLGRERYFQGAGMLDVLRALQSV